MSFYDAFGEEACCHFTTHGPGIIYRPAALDVLQLLLWPDAFEPHRDLVSPILPPSVPCSLSPRPHFSLSTHFL